MIAGYKNSSKIGEALLALRLLPQALWAIGKQKVGGVGYCGPPPALGQSRRCSRRCAIPMCGLNCHWSARQRWCFTVATIGPCASKLAATWLLPYQGQGL